jgi:hypothetical protein
LKVQIDPFAQNGSVSRYCGGGSESFAGRG